MEDVEEEDEVQDAVEEEVAQPRNGVSKEDDVVREAIPICSYPGSSKAIRVG